MFKACYIKMNNLESTVSYSLELPFISLAGMGNIIHYFLQYEPKSKFSITSSQHF